MYYVSKPVYLAKMLSPKSIINREENESENSPVRMTRDILNAYWCISGV